MAWITDSLRGAINAASALNPFSRAGRSSIAPAVFTHELAMAAYMSSGMLRKVIAIPAEDRVREWRDWQADSDDIAKIEAEERRLGLIAKVKHAELLRGIGGGAIIIVAGGGHDQPLTPAMIREGGIQALNVVSRWQISGSDWDDDLSSPTWGCPRVFKISGQRSGEQNIHPSRVIAFRGAPIPAGAAVSQEDAFWGDSRLLRVFGEVQNADNAQQWFAALVRKAKLLRVGIPNIADYLATDDGRRKLDSRVALIAEGESVLNAVVYDAGNGQDGGGEKINDYQITWAGIPAIADMFDQRVAAVSDIPFTRLMGRSPAGMNATGQYDDQNWAKTVAAGQQLETRPCLEHLDPLLLRSAGVAKPEDVWWRWTPLNKPTAKEETERFKLFMEGADKLAALAAMPERAFNAGVQGVIEENGWMPAAVTELADMDEDERFGLLPDPDGDDPSAITQSRSGVEGGDPSLAGGGEADAPPRRRAANDAAAWLVDATPRPLYVQRKLLNAADLIAWAKANGFDTTLPAGDMHVTVLYSRTAVDPMKMGRDWSEDAKGQIVVRPGGPRAVERLGEDAVVLRFTAPDLEWRHKHMIEAGGSHDWPEYQPHVTLSYGVPAGVDLEAIKPFNGELRFGPEVFEALDLDWKSKVSEK